MKFIIKTKSNWFFLRISIYIWFKSTGLRFL